MPGNLRSLQLILSSSTTDRSIISTNAISTSHPFSCSAGGNGGGLALIANGATWTSITSSNLSFNQAALDGGAFNVTGGATVLVNNSLVGNHVEGRGGAISYAHQCFAPSEFLRSSKSICLFVSMLMLYPYGVARPTFHQYLHQYLHCLKLSTVVVTQAFQLHMLVAFVCHVQACCMSLQEQQARTLLGLLVIKR